ncbi:Hypothetical predicted protein [Mytilus galloprovincialis]|uniref:Tesmin/TSO1-like CXC domain-containing protein n=1 Tax=Mytilus galloprovincialis TaxID=29158 RepID=A0A8B6DMY9_MYTGA|nr:Hypothetical predicted protein [Mytilus galloprovincialis]
MKISMHKQKKEIKDNQTVISCLRKQIAFSKHTQKPVTDLDQFISLPRAISDASGQPLKAGGFDDVNMDKALSSLGGVDGSIVECCHLNSNHEEDVYISSGCDFVSFFHGYGKKTFFDIFRQNADFISSDLSICDQDNIQGLCAFFRLILCVYFSKNRTAFQPAISVREMYDKIICESALDKHVALIKAFRERMWERVTSEVEMIPNAEALKLHWLRCCWVMQYWKQGNTNFMSLPDLNSYGWNISDGEITVVWDTEINLKKVNDTIQWYTKGCSCKSGSTTLRCSCKKSANKYCSPGCKCVNCVNLPTNLNQAVDDPDSDLEDSEQEEDISYESDSETDINEFAADTSGNSSTAYKNYWDTFENYIFAD